MGKWIAGVAATVIGGILVFWLTVGIQPQPTPRLPQPTPRSPQPTPKPKITKGYLVVLENSNIHKAEDLRRSDKICAFKSGAEFLRAFPPFSEQGLRVLPANEMYQALRMGVCNTAFVFQRESADKLFPVGITGMRLIPVYDK